MHVQMLSVKLLDKPNNHTSTYVHSQAAADIQDQPYMQVNICNSILHWYVCLIHVICTESASPNTSTSFALSAAPIYLLSVKQPLLMAQCNSGHQHPILLSSQSQHLAPTKSTSGKRSYSTCSLYTTTSQHICYNAADIIKRRH